MATSCSPFRIRLDTIASERHNGLWIRTWIKLVFYGFCKIYPAAEQLCARFDTVFSFDDGGVLRLMDDTIFFSLSVHRYPLAAYETSFFTFQISPASSNFSVKTSLLFIHGQLLRETLVVFVDG